VVPLALMSAAGVLSQRRIQTLAQELTGESAAAMQAMAERHLTELTRGAARTVGVHLASGGGGASPSPADPRLRAAALQRFDDGAYTALYRHGADGTVGRLWFHPDGRLTGEDLPRRAETVFGEGGERFVRLLTAAGDGAPSQGYVPAPAAGGGATSRFVTAVPLTGTPFVLVGLRDRAPSDGPVQALERRAADISQVHAVKATGFDKPLGKMGTDVSRPAENHTLLHVGCSFDWFAGRHVLVGAVLLSAHASVSSLLSAADPQYRRLTLIFLFSHVGRWRSPLPSLNPTSLAAVRVMADGIAIGCLCSK